MIDAITQAYARDYATVHRGVYERSATMTGRYEAARAAASNLIGGQPNELVFTRGATEAINLVARTLPKNGRNRVLLSQLEHHSNIVPWQLAGFEVDAVPLTPDGQIDLDAAEAMLTEEHRVVAFAHVSNVLGSILDAKRAAEIAHSKGALLLLDGCQAVPRLPRRTRDHRRRLLRLLRAQALRPDRHRLPLGPRRPARRKCRRGRAAAR